MTSTLEGVAHAPYRGEWADRAACQGIDTDAFYHPDNERGLTRRHREAAAKAVCARCPVARECLAAALSMREAYGVWGGLSTQERNRILDARAAPVRV